MNARWNVGAVEKKDKNGVELYVTFKEIVSSPTECTLLMITFGIQINLATFIKAMLIVAVLYLIFLCWIIHSNLSKSHSNEVTCFNHVKAFVLLFIHFWRMFEPHSNVPMTIKQHWQSSMTRQDKKVCFLLRFTNLKNSIHCGHFTRIRIFQWQTYWFLLFKVVEWSHKAIQHWLVQVQKVGRPGSPRDDPCHLKGTVF